MATLDKSPAELLATPVQFLKGVGPQRAEALLRLELQTARDVLFFFPRTYEDLTDLRTVQQLEEDKLQSVCGVVEDVEQPAVEDGFKGLTEGVDPKHVQDLEAGIDAAIGGLAAGDLDGSLGDVDAERFGAVTRGEDGVLAGAAAGIEQYASEQASLGEPDEGRLRAANVPRRSRSGVGVIPVV